MKLKVCGMKLENNISEISKLSPDFMGFIFWPKSKRFFNKKTIDISNEIKKVGVFVNQDYDLIVHKINQFKLDFVQIPINIFDQRFLNINFLNSIFMN